MPVSKAQQKATAKYEAKKYDKALLRMEKGKKEAVALHAQQHGEKSFNGFVNEAIDEKIERDSSGSVFTTPTTENKAANREGSDDE